MAHSSIKEIEQAIDVESKGYLQSYLDFIVEQEFGFLTTQPQCFGLDSKVGNHFDYHYNLVCMDASIITKYHKSFKGVVIDAVFINSSQVFSSIAVSELSVHWQQLTSVRFVHLSMMHNEDYDKQDYLEVVSDFPEIGHLDVHGVAESSNLSRFGVRIVFHEQDYAFIGCGSVSTAMFSCRSKFIKEAQLQNSCLANKISIDADGNIKNCPSMKESFGNVRDTTLAEAIEKPGFKKYWDINKDKIHVCKDCEFRYVCTDCRAYVEDPEDILSKPLKCGYNPYTGEWSEWSTNPLKQKAITYYGMEDLVAERQERLAREDRSVSD
jgi:SPASM domain peptide maturase of grasp-with-spasm system